jgi:hypothetical protein
VRKQKLSVEESTNFKEDDQTLSSESGLIGCVTADLNLFQSDAKAVEERYLTVSDAHLRLK